MPTFTRQGSRLHLSPHRQQLTFFVAGDDEGAKGRALELGRDLGFDAVDAGPLANAKLLEALGNLNIQLGYSQKLGTDIGFRLVR